MKASAGIFGAQEIREHPGPPFGYDQLPIEQNFPVRPQHLGRAITAVDVQSPAVGLFKEGGRRRMFFIPQGAASLGRNLAIQPDAFSAGGRDILLQRPAELRAGGTFLLDDASGVFLSLLQSRVEVALWQGQQEVYEYGVESQLASALSSLIVEYGALGVRATGRALASAAATDETACEILRHLGAMNDPRTRTDRIRILAQHLHSASPRRRYAAAIGLADTNAPEAIALLRDAIQGEPMEELKRRFRRFIALLRP